jgi:hypothetical protein
MNTAPSPEREWFDRALDVPTNARASFPAQTCTDPDVRTRIHAPLDAHDRGGGGVLAQPAGERAAERVKERFDAQRMTVEVQ